MVPYVIRTVYSDVLRQYYYPRGSCNQYRMRLKPILFIKTQNSSESQICHSLAIVFMVFAVETQTVIVCLSDFIMTSEEHWKNENISFQNVYEHMEHVK